MVKTVSHAIVAGFTILCGTLLLGCNSPFTVTGALDDRTEADASGVPQAPGIPTVVTIDDSRVEVEWTAAEDNYTAPERLAYQVVYSLNRDDIAGVEDAAANGTVALDWTAGITRAAIAGLRAETTYYIGVLVRDGAGETSIYPLVPAETTADETPPTVPDSVLNSSAIDFDRFTLSWTAAEDRNTAAANLEYRVAYSESSDLGSPADIQTAIDEGTATAAQDWTADTVQVEITGLQPETSYTVNVAVRDAQGNAASYRPRTVFTGTDTVAPQPGGAITVSDTSDTLIQVDWPAATDSITAQGDLEYRLIYSSQNNIGSVSNAEANGTVARDWDTERGPIAITDLGAATTYYVTVLVRDAANQIGRYAVVAPTTDPDETPPEIETNALSVSDTRVQEIDVSWNAATDLETPIGDLEYRLVYSEQDAVDTGSAIDSAVTANDATVSLDWTADQTSHTITGLSEQTTYFFNVQVRDGNANVSTYLDNAAETEEDMPPQISGTVSADHIEFDTAELSWSAATDDVTASGALEYAVYRSFEDNIGTYSDAQSNGVRVFGWTPNVTAASRTDLAGDLADGIVNYVHVFVRDYADPRHVSGYGTIEVQTTARPDLYIGTLNTGGTSGNGHDIIVKNVSEFGGPISFDADNDSQVADDLVELTSLSDASSAGALVDLDGDGDLDLIRIGDGGNDVAWYLNTADPGQPADLVLQASTSSSTVHAVLTGDITGDGLTDAVLIRDASPVALRNTGFASLTAISQPDADWDGAFTTGRSGALADLNGDGQLDLVVGVDGGGENNVVYFNQGSGVFQTGPNNNAASPDRFGDVVDTSLAMAAGSVTVGDDDPDIVIAQGGAVADTAWYGDGAGSGTEHPAPVTDAVESDDVALGDLDGDGDLDAVFARGGGSDHAQVALNNDVRADGSGSWDFNNVGGAYDDSMISITLADFDGDGDLDIAGVRGDREGNTTNQDILMVWENDGNGSFTDAFTNKVDLPSRPAYILSGAITN